MSRRPTRAELEERCAALEAERDVLALALYYWQRGEPPAFSDACQSAHRSDIATIRVTAYGLERFDGGILVEAVSYDGEPTTATAYRVDAWIASARRSAELLGGEEHHARAAIADRLAAAQREAVETRYRGATDTTLAPKR